MRRTGIPVAAAFRIAGRLLLAAVVSLLVGCASKATPAAPARCDPPTAAAAPAPRLPIGTSNVRLTGYPFGLAATRDGAHLFVALDADQITQASRSGVAVLSRTAAGWRVLRTIPLSGVPGGVALTHAGTRLLVANGMGLAVLDVRRALRGDPTPVVAELTDGKLGSIEVAVTPGDRYAFASAEGSSQVSVYNLANGSTTASTAIATDPVPVGLAMSDDGRYVFVTTEGKPRGPGNIDIIDVDRAVHDPGHAVVSRIAAGCSPVRAVLSASGVLWVSARGSNTLLAFDSSQLVRRGSHALLASVPVGPAPVGVVLVDHDRYALVANSNRFADPNHDQYVTVVDTSAALAHRRAVVGTIPAGRFPRELAVLDDTHALVGNYLSETVEVIATDGLAK